MTEQPENQSKSGFASLGLDDRLVATLAALGYEEPTPIQREAIPPLVAGRDLLGQAATGTGKTAAFALPLIQRVLAARGNKSKGPRGLVLCPTRELAMQVAEAVHRYGQALGVSVLPIYGGQAYEQQVRGLRRGVDIVVATPGRAIDHMQNKILLLDGIVSVVLDEADEMLDMGFLEDIEKILKETPKERQTALISATLPPRVASVAKRYLKDPVAIRIAEEPLASGKLPQVRQTVYIAGRAKKVAALERLLELENPESAIIFCRTRHEVDELATKLSGQGHRVEPLHGGMSQQQRERVIKKLKTAGADLVIATDVAARGLDIERLTHVINFDVPAAPDAYVHRIGRVGRAGREGVAITLAEPRETRLLRNIERLTRQRIELATIPTLADLQARRLDMTKSALREMIIAGDLERYRDIVESLSSEFDIMEVALAAVKMVHKPDPGLAAEEAREQEDAKSQQRSEAPMVRLFVGIGRVAGCRPQDLVGAITGEAGINGRDIGAIQITDRFSLVEIREDRVERVLTAMQDATIKGMPATFRRDTQQGDSRPEQKSEQKSDQRSDRGEPARRPPPPKKKSGYPRPKN